MGVTVVESCHGNHEPGTFGDCSTCKVKRSCYNEWSKKQVWLRKQKKRRKRK